MALRLAAAVAQRAVAGPRGGREDHARGPRERAAAPCLADGGAARHRQGDAGLALCALPAVRPAAGRAVRRRRGGRARRAGRCAGPVAGRCAFASRPVPSAPHAQSRHRPHACRNRRRRRARARRLHAHDAGDGPVARRHRRFGRRDESQQRQCGAEDPRGAAAQRRAADRGACAGPPAAHHPVPLPKAGNAAARRRHRRCACWAIMRPR